ncbi:hypothetical protein GGI23_000881 [Coemansia sp. RSA 2559]|nr:hypothetical protein GGI23_000881 [Coemansia sp. RSA 2559]
MPNYELSSIAHLDPQQVPDRASSQTILAAIDKRREGAGSGAGANLAYNFDYPQQYIEIFDKPEPQEKSVQSILHEQYGKISSFSAGAGQQHTKASYVAANPQYSMDPHSAAGASKQHGSENIGQTANFQRTKDQFSHQPPNSVIQGSSATSSKPRHTPAGGGTLVEYIQAQQDIVNSQKALFAAKTSEKMAALSQQPASPSSNDDSSAASSINDESVQKLNGSMAAMSIGDKGVSGGKDVNNLLSERALHIQRVREASALGKVVTFSRQQVAVDDDTDDENDSVPLGGLRSTGDTCIPDNANNSVNAPTGVGLYHAQGMPHNRSFVGDGRFGAASHYTQLPMQGGLPMNQQAFHHQQYQHMAVPYASASAVSHVAGSLSTGARTPGPAFAANISASSSPALTGMNGFPVPSGGSMKQHPGNTSMSMSMSMAQMQQMQHMQQMPYQGNILGGAQGSPVVANASASFGNGGLYRGAMGGAPDGISPARPTYAPSPLGQVPPIYAHQGMVAGQAQMAVPDVRMAAVYQHGHPGQMQSPMAAYQHGLPGQMQSPMAASAHSLRSGVQQPPQQMPPATSAQQASLTSFIPSQSLNRGAFTRNPLMRDLNKMKEFSAKDYTSRPTLLAEADNRMLAKRNMPGLGGSASHSYQPQPLPQPPRQASQQQLPPDRHRQMNNSDMAGIERRPDRFNRGYCDRQYSPYRFDPGHEKSTSCQNLYGMCNDNASMSSGGSTNRKIDMRDSRGGDRREHKRRHRHSRRGDAYGSEYGEGMPVQEFRRVETRPPPRGYRPLGRHYRRHRDDYYYEQYDYDDASDMYASDCYDEWDENIEYDDYHEEPGHHGKHSVHRGSRGRQRSERGKIHPQTRPPQQKHYRGEEFAAYRGSSKRRPPMQLDDPRGRDGFSFKAAAAAAATTGETTERRGSIGSQSSIISVVQVKPRSQFGRMLANIKRQPENGAQSASKAELTDTKDEEGAVEDALVAEINNKEHTVDGIPRGNAPNSPAASVRSNMPESQANSPACTPKTRTAVPVVAA